MRTRVKICCISSVEEAAMAVRYGADALGLVSAMPSGPGPISEELIAEITATVPPPVATFLLTCQTEADAIIAQQKRTGCSTLQLVDYVSSQEHRKLKQRLPGIRLVQVIHVTGPESIEQALQAAETADALLFDSGNPNLAIKELGGTGRTHNWTVSRTIRERSRVPVFLAGGLTSDNVVGAIAQVEPFGVDICSGVRTNGLLDENKLAAFFRQIETGDIRS